MEHRSTFNSLWLTAPIALLLAIASGCGVFINGLYRDIPHFVAQAKGQDLISLVVVLPTLISTATLANRGSMPARLIWLGGLIYLVYCYVMAAFTVKYNQLFLVYIALLGCSLYALVGNLVTLDMVEVKACFTEKASVKVASSYLAVLAFLFYAVWLSEIIPALAAGKIPQSVVDNGTPTNSVHVLDMAWILPAFVITSIGLRRNHPWGYPLAGALLSYLVLLVLAILSMVVFLALNGEPVTAPQVVIFGTVFTSGMGILVWFLRGFRSIVTPQVSIT